MSANNSRFYGISTAQLTSGLSSVVGVSAGPSVLEMVITGITGGLLYAAGASFADNGSLIARGALIQSAALPLSLGVASVYFSSTGSATVVSIMKKLSDGYNAADVLTT